VFDRDLAVGCYPQRHAMLACLFLCVFRVGGGHWSGSVFFGLSLSVPSLHNSIC
jgi:hypothetical protein